MLKSGKPPALVGGAVTWLRYAYAQTTLYGPLAIFGRRRSRASWRGLRSTERFGFRRYYFEDR